MIHLLIFYNNKKMFTLTQQLENNHPVVVSVPNLQYRKLLTEVLCFSIKKLHQFYSLFRSSRTIFTMRRRNKFSCLFYTSTLYIPKFCWKLNRNWQGWVSSGFCPNLMLHKNSICYILHWYYLIFCEILDREIFPSRDF